MDKLIKVATVAVALVSFLATGCNKASEVSGPVAKTQIIPAPAVYGAFLNGPETRAIDLESTAPGGANYYYNGFVGEPTKTKLPVGTTVWLTYRKGAPTSGHATAVNAMTDEQLETVDPTWFTWGTPDLQAYIVENVAGYNALYPIQSDIDEVDGTEVLVVDPNITYTNPLYLEEGFYQFRMVTPAYPIKASNLSMQVSNGMYLFSNDERYEQTRSKIIRVRETDAAVMNIVLNPIIAQMARISVEIKPGENVNTLEMMSPGVEVSGMQDPELDGLGKLAFKWTSMDLRDTLEMKRGHKYSRTYMTDFDVDENGVIRGDIGVLPTNAMSTVSYILINMAVNGIPTQYVLTMSRLKFFHGHTYDLKIQVDADGHINVMSWANQAWSGEVTLN